MLRDRKGVVLWHHLCSPTETTVAWARFCSCHASPCQKSVLTRVLAFVVQVFSSSHSYNKACSNSSNNYINKRNNNMAPAVQSGRTQMGELLEQAVSYRTTGNELSHQSSAGKTRVGQTERSFRSVTNTGDSFVRYCEPSTELWLPLALDADMASNSVKLM
jgi:hypothetical protein